jgi:multicomponent K+:H+ antiporter subunit E
VRFVLVVHWDILTANMAVAILILGPPRRLRPGFVELPLDLTDEFAITLLASTISLTPGTVSADVSEDRRTLLIHALDVDDQDAMIRQIKQRYERPLKEIFEC